jgi:hypothetical protein
MEVLPKRKYREPIIAGALARTLSEIKGPSMARSGETRSAAQHGAPDLIKSRQGGSPLPLTLRAGNDKGARRAR